MNRNDGKIEDRENPVRQASFRPIMVPRAYEGVGRALASAFSATDQSMLPQDMERLLDKLDSLSLREQKS